MVVLPTQLRTLNHPMLSKNTNPDEGNVPEIISSTQACETDGQVLLQSSEMAQSRRLSDHLCRPRRLPLRIRPALVAKMALRSAGSGIPTPSSVAEIDLSTAFSPGRLVNIDQRSSGLPFHQILSPLSHISTYRLTQLLMPR